MDSSNAVKKNSKQLNFDKIIEFYQKENIFNPNKGSPNKFINKLEYRMKQYYNVLYNSYKRKTE